MEFLISVIESRYAGYHTQQKPDNYPPVHD
jgi:hypothetical protein